MIEPSTHAELRRFGVTLASLTLVFGVGVPCLRGHAVNRGWFVLAGILLVLAVVRPSTMIQIRKYWGMVGDTLGAVNTYALLTIVYFLILTPIALILRLRGVDKLNRKFEPQLNSYRQKSSIDMLERIDRIF